MCVNAVHWQVHLSGVILFFPLVLLDDAGEAAGVGGGAGKVLGLWDGRCSATHGQTTHLGHSEHQNTSIFQLDSLKTFIFSIILA